MKRYLAPLFVVAGLAAAGLPAIVSAPPVGAQQPLPNIAANTVLGRLGIGTGPAQQIPFANLFGNLLLTATGDFTCTVAGVCTIGSGAVTGGKIASATVTGSNIAANTVANSNLSQMSANGFKGNNTGAAGNVQDLTPTQAGALLTGLVGCVPSKSVLTSGTNATYTTPTCNSVLPTRLEWALTGGGGGGAGSGTTPGAATSGGNTCVNTSGTACSSPLFSANGGGNASGASGGSGGTATGCDVGFQTSGGENGGTTNAVGGIGGGTRWAQGGGGGANGGGAPSNGGSQAANTGAGGGGASSGGTTSAGGGGGAGGYCEKIVTSPAASYVYTIGAQGSGGTLGTSGAAGGNGATGNAVVTAYWQ